MGILYSAADIAISRAGASVVCELAIHRIPSILIPYPFAGSHQVQNARFFKTRKAAIVIEESDLSEAVLIKEIEGMMTEKRSKDSMSEGIGRLAVLDAGKRLADEVGSLLWRN